MRIAKILAVIFALILVVVCFNSPVISADHPWDEDNGGNDDGGTGSGPDSTDVVEPDRPATEDGTNGFLNPSDPGWLIDLQLFFWLNELPEGGQKGQGGGESNGGTIEANLR